MKKKNLSSLDIIYLLSLTDDKYLDECENYSCAKVPLYRRQEFITVVSTAACFVLIVFTAFYTRTGMMNGSNECEVEPSADDNKSDNIPMYGETMTESYDSTESYIEEMFPEAAEEEDPMEAALVEEEAPVEEEVITEAECAEELPMLTMDTELDFDGGFEGVSYASDEEFLAQNPDYLPENDSSLPVYKNPHPNNAGVPGGLTFDEMKTRFAELCGYFDVDGTSPVLDYDENNTLGLGEDYVTYMRSEGYFTHSQSDETVVNLNADGSWSVFFGEAVTTAQDCTTAEEAMLYFAGMFGDVLSLGDEVKVEIKSNRNLLGEMNSSYYIYRKSDFPDEDELLSREFDFAELYLDENLSLTGIRRTVMQETAEKVGDYPIISADEALDMLKSGAFLTTVPEEYFTSGSFDGPLSVELCYRSESQQQYFMPCYRFTVKLNCSTTTDDGVSLTSYGAFYVPAVDSVYIDNFGEMKLYFN